jgi:hypothetical protein
VAKEDVESFAEPGNVGDSEFVVRIEERELEASGLN